LIYISFLLRGARSECLTEYRIFVLNSPILLAVVVRAEFIDSENSFFFRIMDWVMRGNNYEIFVPLSDYEAFINIIIDYLQGG
jgi:hypothetical protein